jgi:hypothetical protein
MTLSTLLAAGGFDEHLLSSTDRDLCIRLADMGCVRYARLPQFLVHHFAEPDRLRLSTRGSASKWAGLNAFWQKYLGRMSDKQRQDFCQRAKQLFDWQPVQSSAQPVPITNDLAITNIERLLCHPTADSLNDSAITVIPPAIQPSVTQWLHQQRLHSARQRLLDCYPLSEVRFLGAGSEGIVFTDERLVYKCIDYWKMRLPSSKLQFLQSQVDQWQGLSGLYGLHSVLADGHWIILTYAYESSAPYQGGHEQSMISLLNSCSIAGIVCNNIHPKNLILVDSEIKLIDYGSDIHPWSLLGFEHMTRRAYLSVKYSQHPKLSGLMREVLHHSDLPEMEDYSAFRSKLVVPAKLLTQTVRDPKPIAKPEMIPEPFTLVVAIISADPLVLAPLLRDLHALTTCESLTCLHVLLLDNACPEGLPT